ncbi:MAG: PD-(D/E)XK nuclease family protein [Treponema sp.]|nr:PD-(D/E)XK nuclease family protein [Treponema sp.]
MILDKYSKQISQVEEINRSFNIFKILKIQEYEVRHSAFLSWLFNPKGSHGLGQNFANNFFHECFGDSFDGDCSTITSVKTEVATSVLTEVAISGEEQEKKSTDRKRIDILIEGDKFTCTIENKYGSSEHEKQCLYYREFIEGRKNSRDEPNEGKNPKYPVKDGWKNYFVFLDIEKPDNFDKEHTDTYGDYVFIDYRAIKEILKKLIESKNKEKLEITFIQHYIDILEEKYVKLSPKFEEICQDIKADDMLEIIACSEDENLSSSELLFINVVKKYYKDTKRKNDEAVKKILLDIIHNNEEIIKDDYHAKNKKEVKYAYTLKVFEGKNPPLIPGFKEGSKEDIIKTIDFNVSKGINIGVYAGMNVDRSHRLIEFIKKHDDFAEKIALLRNQGWECNFVFSVLKKQWFEKHEPSCIVCEVKYDFSKTDKIHKLQDYINNQIYNQIGEKKNIEVYQYFNELRKLECFENIDQAESQLNEYIVNKIRKDPNLKKENIKVVIHWLIKLDYSLKDKSNNKIYNITNDNIDFVKQEFINRTKEALNLFGLGDRYANSVFI